MATTTCSKISCGWRVTRPNCLRHPEGETKMSTQLKPDETRMIFRGTNAQKGRHLAITPENSAMKHLFYGRIILDRGEPRATFATGPRETGLICLHGSCTIVADSVTNEIGRHDSIYLPRDTEVEITTN